MPARANLTTARPPHLPSAEQDQADAQLLQPPKGATKSGRSSATSPASSSTTLQPMLRPATGCAAPPTARQTACTSGMAGYTPTAPGRRHGACGRSQALRHATVLARAARRRRSRPLQIRGSRGRHPACLQDRRCSATQTSPVSAMASRHRRRSLLSAL